MDFDRKHFEARGFGEYQPMDVRLLPPLYLAYRSDLSQVSGIYHSNLRQRWEQGDPQVVDAMEDFANFAERGRETLLKGDVDGFSRLMNRNFDLRANLVQLDPKNVEMVRLARRLGVSAKYAGSGGSIVGVCPDEATFEALVSEFAEIGCTVIRPSVS